MPKRATLLFSLSFSLCAVISLLPVGLAQAPDVTVWSISVEQDELYRELEATFSERYPEYTVKFETFSQDAFQQNLPLSFESGDAPDVVLASFDVPMSELLADDWLAPVAGDAEIPEAWFSRFPESTFVDGHNMVGEVVYGVPTNEQDIWGPGYMFYNRTILEDAGIDPDAEVPATWSELLAVCERVKAAEYPCFTASFDSDSNVRRWWTPFTSVAQTWTPFNYQTGTFNYADESRLRAWELLKTLYDGEHFIPGVETTDRETSRQIFALDQAAFYMDGAWMPSVFSTGMEFPDLNYGVAPAPRPDDGVQGALHKGLLTSRLHVTSAVRNPEAAWALIDFLTEPEGDCAKGYIGGGFGFLSFANNSELAPDDEVLSNILKSAEDYRKFEPVPLLACEGMAESTAYDAALSDPTIPSEEVSLVEALATGQDWTETAEQMATQRQALFEKLLAAEKAKGLNVDQSYFTYADWDFNSDFDYSNYPLCN